MQKQLIGQSSPFLHDPHSSTRNLMGNVILALIPAGLASIWFFGWSALTLILVSVAFAVAGEWAFEKLAKKPCTIGDLSAVVTGMLVAYNISSNAPWWMAALGSVLAIVLVKQFFGGIGQNFMNPALAARTFLMLSWAGLMAGNLAPQAGQIFGLTVADAATTASPLMAEAGQYSLWDLFIGNIPGMLGETSKLAILIGGIYLAVRKIIDWRIPVAYIGTAFVLFLVEGLVKEEGMTGALQFSAYQLLSGGLMLGAFFMATDYVTSPMTKSGRVIMGVGCALILWVIRAFNKSYPEGCSFGILFMNVMTPLIDKWTLPKTFGAVKPQSVKGE